MTQWSSLKFRVAEELGECMDCTYIKMATTQDEKSFTILPHEQHDGISGLTHILENEGYLIHESPILRDANKPPGFFEKFFLLIKFIKKTSKVNIIWKKEKLDIRGNSLGFSYHRFDDDSTNQIKNYCRSKKVSLTAFLMSSLDEVVTSRLLAPGSERKWVSTINMRGGVSPARKSGNYSASIIINANDSFDEKRWNIEFVSFLKKKLHWGSWLYSNMARLVGEKGVRSMAGKLKDLGVGILSNMGEWPPEGIIPPENQSIKFGFFPVAPASQLLPVAAVSAIWYGELCLTLRVHPSIQLNQEEIMRLHNHWLATIQQRVGLNSLEVCEFVSREEEYQ